MKIREMPLTEASFYVAESLISDLQDKNGGCLKPEFDGPLKEAFDKAFVAGVNWVNDQQLPADKRIEMIPGRYYFISFGDQTQLVVRFREEQVTTYNFYDCLHYWNRHESYRNNNAFCVKSGIVELRPATLPEKNLLINKEIEHDDI